MQKQLARKATSFSEFNITVNVGAAQMLPVASISMVPTISASTLNSSHVTTRRATRPVQELTMQTMSMKFFHVSMFVVACNGWPRTQNVLKKQSVPTDQFVADILF